ncbi:MAG: very short patch repair endonuclease [Dehalococcoidia bacterium]
MRSGLHRRGLRFRLHVRRLPGKPDMVFPKFRAVVFVHGCFWHQHVDCREGRLPSTNVDYWTPKLARNVRRQAEHERLLAESGWRVCVVWECQVERHLQSTIDAVEWFVRSRSGDAHV